MYSTDKPMAEACKSLSGDEQVAIVDKQNNLVGKADRAVMRKFILPHRATYIVLRNSSGRFYVQRRTMNKDYCPGYLDPMSGGVVQYNESFEENACRELFEEMGVKGIELRDLGSFFYQDEKCCVWGGMFEGTYDGELVLQKEEVDEVLVMSMDEIIRRSDEFTPDGMHALTIYSERTNERTNEACSMRDRDDNANWGR